MNGVCWQEVFAIFEEVVARPSFDRPGLLERLSPEGAVRRGVEALLAAHSESAAWLDRPAAWLQPAMDRPAPSAAASPLARLGSYRLLRLLGRGGTSEVYLAVGDERRWFGPKTGPADFGPKTGSADVGPATGSAHRVAIKILRPDLEAAEVARRLRAESRILARLEHPHIARLYEGGTSPELQPYLVMEYVDGLPIDRYCEERRLDLAARLGLFREVCGAVHHAHLRQVIHRDLKPSNILITAAGEPKLLDFGIAKLLGPDGYGADHETTAPWLRLLTPGFASPEQLRGEKVGPASDVFALGVLLYLLLTGRLPFPCRGLALSELEQAMTSREPVAPSRAGGARRLPGELDALVLKALQADPARRYPSVAAFAAALARFEAHPPAEARLGVSKPRRRRVLACWGLALLLLSCVVAALLRDR